MNTPKRRVLSNYIIKDKADKSTIRIVLAESPKEAISLFINPLAMHDVYAIKM